MPARRRPPSELQQELQDLQQRRKHLEDAIRSLEALVKMSEEKPRNSEFGSKPIREGDS